ncbi:MAG TPA: RNA methyltransferase [Thermotogota bacterium]|nr:RNA methyltransferase [Thermotogota bacterium]
MLNKIYVALIHYPCLGKDNKIISTAVTNIDIHDIARTCRTYDIKKYFMVTNLPAQQEIIRRVLKFWIDGSGRRFNENRTEALYEVALEAYYEDVIEEITQKEGEKPLTVFTSARIRPNTITFRDMSDEIRSQTRPILLIFGTGHGLPNEILSTCDYSLEPVRAFGDFNHLSVRSAIAIILDRLIGEEVFASS